MQNNKMYETIIIGAEPAGLALAEALAKEGLQVAIASSNFIYNKNYNLSGVDLIENTVLFLSFSHGLFGLTLADRSSIFGQSVVFATGTKPLKSNLKNSNISYKVQDILIKDKNAPVVVFGDNDQAVSSALELAKQFRYVYLCTNSFEFNCSKRLVNKLADVPNIVHLPGCNITSCKNDKEGKLVEVSLDTYTSIKTTALLLSLGRIPDVPAFAKRFLAVDENGYAITSNNESTKVPLVFALGGVLKKSTKKDISRVAQKLSAYFKGGNN